MRIRGSDGGEDGSGDGDRDRDGDESSCWSDRVQEVVAHEGLCV